MSLRFGLVGAGGIAQSYVEVFAGVADARIVGVADPDIGAGTRIASALGAERFDSVDGLLDGTDLDAVVICTPPVTHSEIALRACARGVGVLCEKPLAIGVDAARSMVAAAKAAEVPFTMATKFRFVDDVVRGRELVDGGLLGDVIQLENAFASRVDMSRRWNSDRAVSGGGVVIDNGTHSVDIARYFLGPILDVMVVEGPRTQAIDVEDSARMVLRAATGATAAIDLSWSFDNAADTYLQVYGTEGALRVGWKTSAYRENDDAEWVEFGSGYNKIRCMRSQVENFCGALRGTEPLAISVADAIASVQVISAAYESLRLGDWVAVESVRAVADAATTEDVA